MPRNITNEIHTRSLITLESGQIISSLHGTILRKQRPVYKKIKIILVKVDLDYEATIKNT